MGVVWRRPPGVCGPSAAHLFSSSEQESSGKECRDPYLLGKLRRLFAEALPRPGGAHLGPPSGQHRRCSLPQPGTGRCETCAFLFLASTARPGWKRVCVSVNPTRTTRCVCESDENRGPARQLGACVVNQTAIAACHATRCVCCESDENRGLPHNSSYVTPHIHPLM